MGSCSPLTPAHLGHQKDEHGLRKLRTAPRDVLQEVTDRVTTALHGHSPGACHPGPQEVRASLGIWWLDPGSGHMSPWSIFPTTRGQGRSQGPPVALEARIR